MIPLMFTAYIPEISYQPRSKRKDPITEAEYYETDKELLKSFSCPICRDCNLFRGFVYIGCNSCLNFFSEKDIIEANI